MNAIPMIERCALHQNAEIPQPPYEELRFTTDGARDSGTVAGEIVPEEREARTHQPLDDPAFCG